MDEIHIEILMPSCTVMILRNGCDWISFHQCRYALVNKWYHVSPYTIDGRYSLTSSMRPVH